MHLIAVWQRPASVRCLILWFDSAIKLLLVSFDSTVKSNLSVGLPFDLQVYENEPFDTQRTTRIFEGGEVYQTIATGWGNSLRDALQLLPSYEL